MQPVALQTLTVLPQNPVILQPLTMQQVTSFRDGPEFANFPRNFSSCNTLPCNALKNTLKIIAEFPQKLPSKFCVKDRDTLKNGGLHEKEIYNFFQTRF